MKPKSPAAVIWVIAAFLWLAAVVDTTQKEDGAELIVPNDSGKTVPAGEGESVITGKEDRRPSQAPCIDINSAGAAELDRLPGVGPVIARRIIDYRESHGAFKRLSDVDRVKGIGPATLKKMEGRLCF